MGLILTERMINIPSEVAPPMYQMLLEEITWAVAEKEPYTFSHYLILSKTYQEITSLLDQELDRPKKKKKQKMLQGASGDNGMFFFHPEDEILQRHAVLYGGFDYIKQRNEGHSDSKRTFQDFGIQPRGHLILIEATQFQAAVEALLDFFSQH